MRRREDVKIIIEADSKEIADITKALQSQLKEKFSDAVVDVIIQKCHSEISENSINESEY